MDGVELLCTVAFRPDLIYRATHCYYHTTEDYGKRTVCSHAFAKLQLAGVDIVPTACTHFYQHNAFKRHKMYWHANTCFLDMMRQDKTVPKTVKSHSISLYYCDRFCYRRTLIRNHSVVQRACHLNVISLYLLISFLHSGSC